MREEKDTSPRPISVKDEKKNKDKKVERERVEKGCNIIVAGVRKEKENKKGKFEREKVERGHSAIVVGARDEIDEKESRERTFTIVVGVRVDKKK